MRGKRIIQMRRQRSAHGFASDGVRMWQPEYDEFTDRNPP